MMLVRRKLYPDQAGVTAVEFALVAPVFLGLVMTILNLGQMMLGMAVLNGAVQEAARGTTVQGADTSTVDDFVKGRIAPILPDVTIASTRKSYFDFIDVKRPEKFTDTNQDGKCSNSEPYTDENNNGKWDDDVGKAGNGGANDVTLYTVKATYKPMLTVPLLITDWSSTTLTASVIKKNEPYDAQGANVQGTTPGTCT